MFSTDWHFPKRRNIFRLKCSYANFIGRALPKPIISVRTGSRIGTVVSPIINPANLHIDGFYSQNNRGVSLILQDLSIREFGPKGIIINEPSDLTELEELIRIKPVVELKFELIGKGVVSSVEKSARLLTMLLIKIVCLFINYL